MSLQSFSYFKASIVLTRVDHLFIYNYIKSLLYNTLRHILMIRIYSNESYSSPIGLEPATQFLFPT